MVISNCYRHLLVRNGYLTFPLTSNGQEWKFHIAMRSSGKEWQFPIATDIYWSRWQIYIATDM